MFFIDILRSLHICNRTCHLQNPVIRSHTERHMLKCHLKKPACRIIQMAEFFDFAFAHFSVKLNLLILKAFFLLSAVLLLPAYVSVSVFANLSIAHPIEIHRETSAQRSSLSRSGWLSFSDIALPVAGTSASVRIRIISTGTWVHCCTQHKMCPENHTFINTRNMDHLIFQWHAGLGFSGKLPASHPETVLLCVPT